MNGLSSFNQKNSKNSHYESMDELATSQGYIKLADAGKIFNVPQNYLNVLIHRKKIEGKKFGRNWYTTKGAVDDYLKKQRLTVILPTPASYRREISNPTCILSEQPTDVKSKIDEEKRIEE